MLVLKTMFYKPKGHVYDFFNFVVDFRIIISCHSLCFQWYKSRITLILCRIRHIMINYLSMGGEYVQNYGWYIVGLCLLFYVSRDHIKTAGSGALLMYDNRKKELQHLDERKRKARESQQKQNWQIELDRLV